MGFMGFVIGFISALLCTMFLIVVVKNAFVVSIFVALVVGMLAAKD